MDKKPVKLTKWTNNFKAVNEVLVAAVQVATKAVSNLSAALDAVKKQEQAASVLKPRTVLRKDAMFKRKTRR